MCHTHKHSGSGAVEATLPRSATQGSRSVVSSPRQESRLTAGQPARLESKGENPFAGVQSPAVPKIREKLQSATVPPTPAPTPISSTPQAQPAAQPQQVASKTSTAPSEVPLRSNFEVTACAQFAIHENRSVGRFGQKVQVRTQVELPADQPAALRNIASHLTKLKAEEPPDSRSNLAIKTVRTQWMIQAIVDVSALLGIDASHLRLNEPETRNTQLTLIRTRYAQMLKLNNERAPAAKPDFFGFPK